MLRPIAPRAGLAALAVGMLAGIAVAEPPVEEQLDRTLVQWRISGERSFVTTRPVPRRTELVVRLRRRGNTRSGVLEFWAAAENRGGGNTNADFAPAPRPNRPGEKAAERLARWQNLTAGQVWATHLPADRAIGLMLAGDSRDKATRIEFRRSYHTLHYKSGWALDVWVVPDDEWLDDR